MTGPARLDDIDIRLLELLQEHGRTSQHDLAQAVGLSSPAVAERLRKLEERGIIRQFTVLVDPRRVGRDVTAFIFVGINGSHHYPQFRAHVAHHPEVLECHSVTGQGSHLLKIRTDSTSTLEGLLAEIQAWPGVQWTTTSIVLSTVKETSALALGPRPTGADAAATDGAAVAPER
ncbi:MAG TPA: Lrp/AsnC family transcriptional regulator [Longimicrobium sp.]|uniref:Lrp/AsnC family transcriptional regulator n=1 Tax=Longimicrobium sp. TaxID=2029185 RepID=UPI002ED83939